MNCAKNGVKSAKKVVDKLWIVCKFHGQKSC